MTVAVPPTVTDGAVAAPSRRWTDVVRAYVGLTKPRIVQELLITTVPAMVLAARGWPSTATVLLTVLGGSLAAGSANTINCYVDRDIDQVMRRTRRRPLVRHAVQPRSALVFGLVLGVAATLLFGLTVNWLAAWLAVAAICFYVFVYTLGLKRRHPSNIVIGGAAGCFPVIIGWAAVTGSLAAPAWVMFALIFFWTPPHFWALAMRFKDDYAAAGVPMLPVVADVRTVARRIVGYSYLMVGTSLLLVPIGGAGWLYAAVATGAGAVFLVGAHALRDRVSRGEDPRPMKLFHLSITYLTVVFAAIAAGQFVG